MELTEKQAEAQKIATTRYLQNQPYTVISGYAGTGKTTLISWIVNSLGLYKDEVAYIAYTGKASLVLKEKGCENAMTAHKLLYKSIQRADGTFYHIPKDYIGPYKLIVVDEVSMLPKELWELLLKHHIHVLAFGDPAQLPPIGEENGILDNPDVFLDEVVRQAKENEIIKLSMDIREGKPLVHYKGSNVQILEKSEYVDGMLLWADQIICAKNSTRRAINNKVREMLYETNNSEPVEGDKVICLHNEWDTMNENGDAIVNGTIGTLSYLRKKTNPILKPLLLADFLPEGESVSARELDPCFHDLNVDYKLLTTGEPTVSAENFKRFPKMWKPFEFDYGYCITCWKAQGSQYNKVLIFEEDFPFEEEEHRRFLYTAITRAVDKVVIIKK